MPSFAEYRVVQLSWDHQIPFIAQSTLIATIQGSTYPAISVVKVKSLREQSHDLLVLRPDRSLVLLSGTQVYPIDIIRSTSTQPNSLQIVLAGDRPIDQRGGQIMKAEIEGLAQRAGSMVEMQTVFDGIHEMSFDFIPRNQLTKDILAALRYALPPHDFSSLQRRRLQLWLSENMPSGLREEVDCLWTALFELIGCDSPSLSGRSEALKRQGFEGAAYSFSSRRFADDAVLAHFRIPHPTLQAQNSTRDSSLAAQVLLSLHLLSQSLRIDIMRHPELEHILGVVFRLSKDLAPGWADYWSRIFPDILEAWNDLGGRYFIHKKSNADHLQ